MTRDDYLKMAEEYKQQAYVLSQKIEEKEKLRRVKFDIAALRNENERSLVILYDMRNDVLYSMKRLIQQAENMEDNDE